jgi:hypothetical protein
MSSRRNSDLGKIHASLLKTCPHRETSIATEQHKRIDWEHLEYRQCGKQFIPGKG